MAKVQDLFDELSRKSGNTSNQNSKNNLQNIFNDLEQKSKSTTQPTESFDFTFDSKNKDLMNLGANLKLDPVKFNQTPSQEGTGLAGPGTTSQGQSVQIQQAPISKYKPENPTDLVKQVKSQGPRFLETLSPQDKDFVIGELKAEKTGRDLYNSILSTPTGESTIIYNEEDDPLENIKVSLEIGRDQFYNSLGKVAEWAGFEDYGKSLQEESARSMDIGRAKINQPLEEANLLDSRFWTQKVPETIPLAIGIGLGALGGAIAGTAGGTALAGTLGIGATGTSILGYAGGALGGGVTSRFTEGLLEGGETYSTLKAQGVDEDTANKQAFKTVGDNMKLMFSDTAQLAVTFLPIKGGSAIKKTLMAGGKIVTDATLEGVEEVWQGHVQQYNQAVGKGETPLSLLDYIKTRQAKEEFITGAGVGMGFASLGIAKDVYDNVSEREAIIDKYVENKDPSIVSQVDYLVATENMSEDTGNSIKQVFDAKLKDRYGEGLETTIENKKQELLTRAKNIDPSLAYIDNEYTETTQNIDEIINEKEAMDTLRQFDKVESRPTLVTESPRFKELIKAYESSDVFQKKVREAETEILKQDMDSISLSEKTGYSEDLINAVRQVKPLLNLKRTDNFLSQIELNAPKNPKIRNLADRITEYISTTNSDKSIQEVWDYELEDLALTGMKETKDLTKIEVPKLDTKKTMPAKKIEDKKPKNQALPKAEPFLREGQNPLGYNADDNQVARERFKISELKRLGGGSDRDVFDLGNGYILKVAKTARGLGQNSKANDYILEGSVIPKTIESGPNYVVSEKIKTYSEMNESERKIIRDFVDEMKKVKPTPIMGSKRMNIDYGAIEDVLTKYGWEDLTSYGLDTFGWNDIMPRNLGIKDGQPVLIDEGTIGLTDTIEQYKGVKNLSDSEFREIYYKSKSAKKKLGDKDKYTKYQSLPADIKKFEGFSDITTKTLEQLKGKETVSYQFISDYTKIPEMKKQEREVIQRILTEYAPGDKINAVEFANKVKNELLPIHIAEWGWDTNTDWKEYTLPEQYLENIGSNEQYAEVVHEVPFVTGKSHFSNENYFGHSRIQFVDDNDTGNKIAVVNEIQNDVMQFDSSGTYKKYRTLSPKFKWEDTISEANDKITELQKELDTIESDSPRAYEIQSKIKMYSDQKQEAEGKLSDYPNNIIKDRENNIKLYENEISEINKINTDITPEEASIGLDLATKLKESKAQYNMGNLDDREMLNQKYNDALLEFTNYLNNLIKDRLGSDILGMNTHDVRYFFDGGYENTIPTPEDSSRALSNAIKNRVSEKITKLNNKIDDSNKDIEYYKSGQQAYKERKLTEYDSTWQERQIRDVIKWTRDQGAESVLFPDGRTAPFIERWVGNDAQGIPDTTEPGDLFEMYGEEYRLIDKNNYEGKYLLESDISNSYTINEYIQGEASNTKSEIVDDFEWVKEQYSSEIVETIEGMYNYSEFLDNLGEKGLVYDDMTDLEKINEYESFSDIDDVKETLGEKMYNDKVSELESMGGWELQEYLEEQMGRGSVFVSEDAGMIYQTKDRTDLLTSEFGADTSEDLNKSYQDILDEMSDSQKGVMYFYQNIVRKYLEKYRKDMYKWTDPNGLEWYRIDFTEKDQANQPVMAYQKADVPFYDQLPSKYQVSNKTRRRVDIQTSIEEALRLAPEGYTIEVAEGLVDDNGNPVGGQIWFEDKKILLNPDEVRVTTASHEVVHAFIDLMSDSKKSELFKQGKKQWGDLSNDEIEERIAEEFKYYEENKNFKTKTLLQKIKDFIKNFWENLKKFVGKGDKIKGLYDSIIDGSNTQPLKSKVAIKFQRIPEMDDSLAPELSSIYSKDIVSKKSWLKGDHKYANSALEFLEKSLVPLDTVIGNINEGVKNRLREFEYNALNSDIVKQARPILERITKNLKGKKLSSDYRILDIALKNSDPDVIEYYSEKLGISKELAEYKLVLDKIFNEGKKSGMDIGYLEDYFPRVVKDGAGLLRELYGTEYGTKIQQAIKFEELKRGEELTDDEKAQIADKMLRGYAQNGVTLTPPGNVKSRTLNEVSARLNQYYYDSMDGLAIYTQAMNDNIEARKLFGKGDNLGESIGAYVMKLVENGDITPTQEIELSNALKARFTNKKMDEFMQAYKNATYLATMGSVSSAITQIQDLGWSLHENGYLPSLVEYGKSLVGKSKIKRSDLGISTMVQEFTEPSKLQGAVTKVFKLVGLDKMDSAGKETFINAYYKKLQKQVENGDFSGLTMLDEQDKSQAIVDLKNGVVSDDIKLVLFSKLLDYQPLTKSQMPAYYNTSGNMRIMYMLKSYTIKQIDSFRREAFSKMYDGYKTGDSKLFAKGFWNLVHLATALALLGAGTDVLKNLLFNRESNISDLIIDNLFKLMGFNKYTIYKTKQEGLSSGLLSIVIPPFNLINDPIKDLMEMFSEDKNGDSNFKGIGKMYTINDIPIGGKLYYWWFGRGTNSKQSKSYEPKSSTSPIRRTPVRGGRVTAPRIVTPRSRMLRSRTR